MSLQTLADAIAKAVKNRKSAGSSTAVKTGTYNAAGETVTIDGRVYNADYSDDVYVEDGEQVYCLLNDGGTLAVIVGK